MTAQIKEKKTLILLSLQTGGHLKQACLRIQNNLLASLQHHGQQECGRRLLPTHKICDDSISS